jgi:hypothetical protein
VTRRSDTNGKVLIKCTDKHLSPTRITYLTSIVASSGEYSCIWVPIG